MQNELVELYNANSKHSKYQILPDILRSFIGEESIEVHSRFERERLAYIVRNLNVKQKSILDIGGNTGFFTFEVLEEGAKHVTYYEGNKVHASFVETAVNRLNLQENVRVNADYFTFAESSSNQYDICFCLNILHHLGDDFGEPTLALQRAKQVMITYINNMALYVDTLVLQLGFNWKGDRNCCLFDKGTKGEQIEFIKNGTVDCWNIEKIGIAEKHGELVAYDDLNSCNIQRQDKLGEFLNRPIFIMRSKTIEGL